MTSNIQWHYPRLDTAESIIRLLSTGALQAITIFAPRNYGKTELVLEDIWPMAEQEGYFVLYSSFWLNKAKPESVFLDMIREPKQRLDFVKTRVGLPGNFVEAQAQPLSEPSDNPLSEIAKEFKKLINKHDRILLMLDEVQTLAKDEHVDFIACIRTLMNTHREQVQVVFTGSSREGLIKLFKKHKAPLFNAAHQYDLPNLDASFVQHQISAFQQASGRNINLAAAIRVFVRQNFVPAHFHDLLISMLISGEGDIEKAYSVYRENSMLSQAYIGAWTELSALARMALVWLANHGEGLYQEQAIQYFSEQMGIPVTTGMLQHQIDLLKENSIIESLSRGQYSFTEEGMRDFVLEQSQDGLLVK